ncbi:unnamed protein product [Lepidochelys kempii]
MTPLAWLEKNMGTSAVMESLRQSLPLPALQQDAGTSVTPISTCSAGTWMTPRALLEKSMNTSVEWPACAKDSACCRTDSLLWHCSQEHLSALSRAELEGRLESTLIIIEALSCQLRDWQQSQWPVPRLGRQTRETCSRRLTVTHPKAEEQLYHDFYMATRERTQGPAADPGGRAGSERGAGTGQGGSEILDCGVSIVPGHRKYFPAESAGRP